MHVVNRVCQWHVAAQDLSEFWLVGSGMLFDLDKRVGWSAAEGTPIVVGDSLVFCTPFNEVIALDPGTGAERWRFDAESDLDQFPANQFVCRGVVNWRDPDTSRACPSRIFMGTNDGRLISNDATTGERCTEFGDAGEVRIDPGMPLIWPGEFQMTSPPVTVGDTVVVGSSISDGVRLAAPVGSVRAFDARTGAERWSWDPIPRNPEAQPPSSWPGSQPPEEGRANAWAPLAADEQRGLVFVPTNNPSTAEPRKYLPQSRKTSVIVPILLNV